MQDVVRLTAGGRGVLADGQIVDRVLPGEKVSVEAGKVRVEQPVPDRVRPPCRHFGTCGGCSLQHASDAFVLAWKVDRVKGALGAQGLSTPIRNIEVSPPQSRRRASFKARRTKNGVMLGFMAKGSDILIDTPECQLITTTIMQGRPRLEAVVTALASRKSVLTLAVTETEGGLDVALDGPQALDEGLRLRLTEIAQMQDLARVSWQGEVIVERRPPCQTFGQAKVTPPPGAFLQATRHGEEALSLSVIEAAGEAKRVADLFAGCGTFALRLAAQANVLAVEGAEAQTRALEFAWRRTDGLHGLTAQTRNLFNDPLPAGDLSGFDAVVIDPPRAGAMAQVKEVAASSVPTAVMVSCNPETFARDVKILVDAGFSLEWVDVVDQFRWSTHVEVAARLTRK